MKRLATALLVLAACISCGAVMAVMPGSSGAHGASAGGILPQSFISPSIEITGFSGLPPNLCTDGGSYNIAVLWTGSNSSASDGFDLVVPGFGDVSNYTETSIGYTVPSVNLADTYGISGSVISTPYNVAADTTITYRLTTWPNNTLSGVPSFTSEMDVNCTTGAVLAIRNFGGPISAAAVPTWHWVAALLAALALAGLGALRLRPRRA